MNYYFVTYLNEDEVQKTTYVQAASEPLIPFSVREQDRLLKHVVSSKEVSFDEYDEYHEGKSPQKPAKEEVVDQSYDDPEHPASAGRMFIKNGKPDGRYVVVDCDKVLEIISVGLGGVYVSYPPTTKDGVVSRHTEVVPYKESEHKHLLKRIIVKKDDEDK